MKAYKHVATRNAVAAIYGYFSEAALLYEQLKNTEYKLSSEGYEQKRQNLQQKFQQVYRSTRQAVEAAVKDAKERAEAAKSSYLTIGNAAADYQLLALPVALTADDLRALAKRNADNPLFLRSVGQYAKEHSMLEDREKNADLRNLQYAKSGADEMAEHADFLRDLFDRVAGDDDFLRIATGYGSKLFADVENQVDFTEY